MPLYHTGKFAATSQQFGGSALLGNRTVFEHHYLVGIGDGSHTVGDDKHGLVAYQLRDACLYLGLVLDVEAGGSFVEQHDRSVFEQGSGDGDALTFATRECGAVLTDESVVALRHTADELVATSELCHSAYLLIGGKSTSAKLAARFWDIDKGTITLGGQDISKIDPEALLKNYAVVFQDVLLFNSSVADNIRIGKPEGPTNAVTSPCRAVNDTLRSTCLPVS